MAAHQQRESLTHRQHSNGDGATVTEATLQAQIPKAHKIDDWVILKETGKRYQVTEFKFHDGEWLYKIRDSAGKAYKHWVDEDTIEAAPTK